MNLRPRLPTGAFGHELVQASAHVVYSCRVNSKSHNPSGRGFDPHPPHRLTSMNSPIRAPVRWSLARSNPGRLYSLACSLTRVAHRRGGRQRGTSFAVQRDSRCRTRTALGVRTTIERGRHSRCPVGEKQSSDVRRSDDIGKLPQEDHRRLDGAGERKLAAEVASISGDKGETLGGCLGEHLRVAGTGHVVVANVCGVMSTGGQRCADSGREVLPHRSGTSRRRPQRVVMLGERLSGVVQCRWNVLRLEIGVLADDVVDTHPSSDHPQNGDDGEAKTRMQGWPSILSGSIVMRSCTCALTGRSPQYLCQCGHCSCDRCRWISVRRSTVDTVGMAMATNCGPIAIHAHETESVVPIRTGSSVGRLSLTAS